MFSENKTTELKREYVDDIKNTAIAFANGTDFATITHNGLVRLTPTDEVPEEKIEVLDLCINPHKGLKLISECRKQIDAVLIQPGAGSDEIKALLDEKHIPYVEGCVLKGLQARGLL